jgi:hypothetical protein
MTCGAYTGIPVESMSSTTLFYRLIWSCYRIAL